MEKIEVQVVALNSSESSPGNFSLVMEDVESKKRMAITIGVFEAQSIAIHLERMQLTRPLTYDIFKTTIIELGGTLKEIIIHNIIDSIFYACLVLQTNTNEEKKIDVRASDAIALAIRFECPIFIFDFAFNEAILKENAEKKSLLKGSLLSYSLEELKDLLEDVLAKEDYESAGRIRDIIKKRQEDGWNNK